MFMQPVMAYPEEKTGILLQPVKSVIVIVRMSVPFLIV